MVKPTLPVPVGVFDQHIAVLGKTRSGKSSVMRLLVERLLDQDKPVCIIDPKGDWWGLRLSADGKSEGYPVVIFGGARADVEINEHVGADVAELVATGNRPSLIDFGGWTVAARTLFYNEFTSALFRHTRGDRWLVVDEIHNFAPKGTLRGEGGAMATSLHWTNRLASEGLGKGVHLIFASQRPQKVHNDTLTSAETLIAMRVLHPSDRGAISDWIKAAGDQSGADVLASLADLQRGEGWAWSPEIRFGPERIAFPLFSTYDSFRAQKADVTKLKGWGDVDLGEINAKLAAVQEEKKANDPRELRKQIAELKKQLSTTNSQPPSSKVETKVVEKPVLKDGQLARAEKIVERAEALAVRFSEFEEDLRGTAKEIRDAIRQTQAAAIHAPGLHRGGTVPRTARGDGGPAARDAAEVRVRQSAAAHRGHDDKRRAGQDEAILPPGERATLTAALQYEGLDRKRLGILTGYKRSSRDAYIARLQAKGLVDVRGAQLFPTDAGRAALNGSYEPLPTGQALIDYWRTRLPEGERKTLDVLIDSGGQDVERDAIDEGTGYKRSSRDAYLTRLKARGLVEFSGRGLVRASDELFE